MSDVSTVARTAAAAEIAKAERHLAVARRAAILVEGAIATGTMTVPFPNGSRIERRAEYPHIFSQAWSLADRTTP